VLANAIESPRYFFEKIVRPSYEAWLPDSLSEWKAKAAASNANIMAERMFVFWFEQDPSMVAVAKSAYEYRTYLRQNFPDFGLVWDVDDGHKHMTIDRKPRQVTSATQTGIAKMGWGEGGWGEGLFGGGDQIIIQLDDHSKRALSAVMKNVMAMWEAICSGMPI
jgi:hypothetical protein